MPSPFGGYRSHGRDRDERILEGIPNELHFEKPSKVEFILEGIPSDLYLTLVGA
tara:strand:+ start:492 stop:653 length:162 start_codon:yes stop_codon:yes gene_type:complete